MGNSLHGEQRWIEGIFSLVAFRESSRLLHKVLGKGVLAMPMSGNKIEFTKAKVDESPDSHGVYALFDGELLIYYGEASGKGVTIRSRLQSHQRGDEGYCTKRASHCQWEQTEDAEHREAELIVDFQNGHEGKRPRCNKVTPMPN
jgi:hypothetical protein